MTEMMMDAIKTMGKTWNSGAMHRFYINLDKAVKMYRDLDDAKMATIPMSSREMKNGKVWIDLDAEDLTIEVQYIDNAEDVAACIRELIDFLCPAPAAEEVTETEEEIETEEETEEVESEYKLETENGEWDMDEAARLCDDAGLADEWEAADGETFEQVIYKAARIMGVEV